MLTHDGKTQSLKEWAAELNILPTVLRYRVVTKGESIAEVIAKDTKPLSQVAEENGIPYGTLWHRVRRGMTVDEALAYERPVGRTKEQKREAAREAGRRCWRKRRFANKVIDRMAEALTEATSTARKD